MVRKRYIGGIPHLLGKTARLQQRVGIPGQVMAQFEEQHLKEARGWWEFCETDFQSDDRAYANPSLPWYPLNLPQAVNGE